jgi:hypothetical protein
MDIGNRALPTTDPAALVTRILRAPRLGRRMRDGLLLYLEGMSARQAAGFVGFGSHMSYGEPPGGMGYARCIGNGGRTERRFKQRRRHGIRGIDWRSCSQSGFDAGVLALATF